MTQQHAEPQSLGSFIDEGIIDATVGFPCGAHNEADIGVAHIRPFNVTTSGEINLEQIKSIPPEAAAGRPRLQRNDIVFNNTNTKELVGKCAVWQQEFEAVFSNHMTRIRVLGDSYNPGFLSYAILHHWVIGASEMLARTHVAQASIMGERFREIEVPSYGLSEQRNISRILDLVREACRIETQQLDVCQALRRAAMRKLFTSGLRDEVKKETEIGPVPESWNREVLGNVADITYGAQAAVANATDPSIGTLILTNVNISLDGRIDLEKRRYYKIPESHRERLTLKKGDVLFNWRSGSAEHVGKTAHFELDGDFTYSSFILRFRPRRCVSSKFLFRFLSHIRSEGFFTAQRNVSSINSVFNASLAATIPVWFPSEEEQLDIVDILDAIDQKLDLHRRKRAVVERLFKSLLCDLMGGAISVFDVDLLAFEKSGTQQVSA